MYTAKHALNRAHARAWSHFSRIAGANLQRKFASSPSNQMDTAAPQLKKQVLAWGTDAFGALGDGSCTAYRSKLQPVEFPLQKSDICQISSTWNTSLAVTVDGMVYQWGHNQHTRKLFRQITMRKYVPKFLEFIQRLPIVGTLFRARMPHPTIVFPFGPMETDKEAAEKLKPVLDNMKRDKLELGDTKSPIAKEAEMEEASNDTTQTDGMPSNRLPDGSWPAGTFEAVVAKSGINVCGVVTKTGHLFTWSLRGDVSGSLGNGPHITTSVRSQVPRVVSRFDREGIAIADVAFGYQHMVCLARDGRVFTCGRADTGVLGTPQAHTLKMTNVYEPKCVQVAVKQHNEASKAKDSGIVYTEDLTYPEMGDVKMIAAGFASTYFVDANGLLWSCGKNQHGELGLIENPVAAAPSKPSGYAVGAKKHYQATIAGAAAQVASAATSQSQVAPNFDRVIAPLPTNSALRFKKIKQISAGLFHVVVLTEDDEVWTWGSTLQGQLGRPEERPFTRIGASSTGSVSPSRSITAIGQMQATKAWSLPPGPVRLPQSITQGCKPVRVFAGMYDTCIVLEDGRSYFCGSHLTSAPASRSWHGIRDLMPNWLKNLPETQVSTDGGAEGLAPYTTHSTWRPTTVGQAPVFSLAALVPPGMPDSTPERAEYPPDKNGVVGGYPIEQIAFGMGSAIVLTERR